MLGNYCPGLGRRRCPKTRRSLCQIGPRLKDTCCKIDSATTRQDLQADTTTSVQPGGTPRACSPHGWSEPASEYPPEAITRERCELER